MDELPRVLAVDDDPLIVEMLRHMLMRRGFEVLTARDALSALRTAYEAQPDAILLDVMMPDMDGFELCRRLREMTGAPIIFVTAKGASEDVARGFTVGGDDYLVKPFVQSELVARVRACLRRSGEREGPKNGYLFPAASIMLDRGHHKVTIEGRVISLTPKEFDVLWALVRHAGKVLSADAILASAWGTQAIGERDLTKQYIYQLRQKIEPDPDRPRYIHTVPGEGYYFDADDLLPPVRRRRTEWPVVTDVDP